MNTPTIDLSARKGSLVVVGVGLRVGQVTLEAKAQIEQAEKLFYGVNDPVTAVWLQRLNGTAESLHHLYEPGKDRRVTYNQMVDVMLAYVRQDLRVCAAFYGNPALLDFPSHQAIERARREGFEAKLVPGVSAEDCLFADLGIDPATHGWQSFDATDFLLCRRVFDTRSFLILWQVGVVAEVAFQSAGYQNAGFSLLVNYLSQFYGPEHDVIIYETARFANSSPCVRRISLAGIHPSDVAPVSTLFVPPKSHAPRDEEMAKALNLPQARL